MSSECPDYDFSVEPPCEAPCRACQKIFEALEDFWDGLKMEGSFADFVASKERAEEIEDKRLRAAWQAAILASAAWDNLRWSREFKAKKAEADRQRAEDAAEKAREEADPIEADLVNDLLEAQDAWEQFLSDAWYCVGLMRGPGLSLTPTDLSRKLLDQRHKEDRHAKDMVQQYYLKHLKPKGIGKNEAAQIILDKNLVLYPYTTIRRWLNNL